MYSKGLYAMTLAQMGEVGLDAIATAAKGQTDDLPGDRVALGALPLHGTSVSADLAAIAARRGATSEDRRVALRGLVWLGKPALAAQESVLALLPPRDQQTFIEARSLAPLYQQVTPLLVNVVSNKAITDTVRLAAMKTLSTAQTDPASAVPALLALVQNSALAPALRLAAIDALGSYGVAAGQALGPLQALLGTAGPQLRPHLLLAIGRIGQAEPAVIETLLTQAAGCGATAEESATTVSAVQALGETGILAQPLQEKVVAALSGLLKCDETIQVAALEALGRQGLPALPALQQALAAAITPGLEQPLSDALAHLGAEAVPMLVVQIAGPDTTDATRRVATGALGNIGAPALSLIMQAWEQGDAQAQSHLLDALYAIGPHAFAALHELHARQGTVQPDLDKLQTIFATTTVTYPGLAVPPALPALIAAATPITEPVLKNVQAMRLIALIGQPAAPAAPALAALLQHPDEQFQCQVAEAVRRIGAESGVAAPALAAALAGHSSTECRFDQMPGSTDAPHALHMIQALAAIGPPASAAVPQLVAAMAEPELRRPAAEALGEIGAAGHAPLLQLLHSQQDRDLRRAAAYALRQSSAPLTAGTALALADLAQTAAATASALRNGSTNADPNAAALLGSLSSTAAAEHEVAAMMASALVVHGYALPPGLAAFGITTASARTCLNWPALANSEIVALGYDPYLDACIFTGAPTAPDWMQWIGWLGEAFG